MSTIRPSVVWRAFGLLLLLVTLALVTAGGASAKNGTPDAKLLRTYQPVLVFHPNEPFQPTKVQSFIEDSELERFTGTSLLQLPLDQFWTVVDADPEPGELPGATPGAFYRLDQVGCEADAPLAGQACYAAAWEEGSGGAAVYGRVARTPTRTVLQYWLFYYDNPLLLPATPVGTFWQSHEGDWEVVNVVLDLDEQPVEAAYSQHCSGQRTGWSDVEKSPVGSTHPVAYVALGSHANYFATGAGALGSIPISPACIPAAIAPILPSLPFLQVVDQVLAGPSVGPPGSGLTPATIQRIDGAPWSSFGGRWGESEYFFTPIPLGPVPAGAVPVGLAPASPPYQAHWNPGVVLGWPLVP
ncbi:MAG TPA: hypothetical protein VFM13_01180 [Gaiellaceae bacterium]|nr:hypothetical protein [Gaiellaceae bacterium]